MSALRREKTRPAAAASTVQDFCSALLDGGRLADKLRPPPAGLVDGPAEPRFVDAPAREGELVPRPGGGSLPPLNRLQSTAARVRCLQRFAHHELMAVELFAWALLAWPEAPPRLRRGWLAVLADEQRHLRLYLDRLAGLGAGMGAASTSDYFWRHVPALRASPHGVRAFLAAMGMTFEQANLDFAGTWARAFRNAGDPSTAAILERVHRDEIRHVRLAARWLRRLEPGVDAVTAYETAVPFPLGAARAKGRRFDAASRRRAGLDEAFIRHVQNARPAAGSRRSGVASHPLAGAVLWPNVGGEEAALDAPARSGPARRVGHLWGFLHGPGTCLVSPVGDELVVTAPSTLAGPAGPVWPGLEDRGRGVAWWPSRAAAEAMASRGTPLAGCSPEVALQVHDKGFTVSHAATLGHLPEDLRPLIRLLPPDELRGGGAMARLEACLDGWPAWTGGRFTLKPRLGTSGRRRVGGVAGRLDRRVAGALERLAAGGGAVLEPWLTRTGDYSVQMLVDVTGQVRLLGTTRQLLRRSGTVIGNRGVVDAQGHIGAGTLHDAALVAAARALAGAAAARGFVGPCGVDAFTYAGPDGREQLRPLVELNARATTGLIAIGLLRRVLAAGDLDGPRSWAFLLRAPDDPEALRLPDGVRVVPVPEHPRARRPAIMLLAARETELDAALERILRGQAAPATAGRRDTAIEEPTG